MNPDLTLYLAIEKFVQEKMITQQGTQVASDVDLAELFNLEVEELREVVLKHPERFPPDFMFRLSNEEYAFSESGIIMLGGRLKSERATLVHLQFIEYFVDLMHESGISIIDLIDRGNEL